MALYFGKFSTGHPEQFENKFYAGGKEGSKFYGGIKKDDYVFPIYNGKVDRLWQVKEFTQIQNKINKDGVVVFDEVKRFDIEYKVSSEFLRYKYFKLNLNLVNKSVKSTAKGFESVAEYIFIIAIIIQVVNQSLIFLFFMFLCSC